MNLPAASGRGITTGFDQFIVASDGVLDPMLRNKSTAGINQPAALLFDGNRVNGVSMRLIDNFQLPCIPTDHGVFNAIFQFRIADTFRVSQFVQGTHKIVARHILDFHV
jgi:hypothetical protein